MKSNIFRFLSITLLLYLCLNVAVHYRWEYRNNTIKEELLSKYDLNNDGIFANEELNSKLSEGLRRLSSDTARGLAPFTLIPISIVLGFPATWIYNILARKRKLTKSKV